MKTMKKLLALVMALALCLSLGVCAMASTVTATEQKAITLGKTYSITGTAAEETFYLVQVGNGTVSQSSDNSATAPALITTTVSIDGTNTDVVSSLTLSSTTNSGNFEITLPSYDTVGVYTYTLNELSSSTAGVGTVTDDLYLVVYVTNSTTTENALEVSTTLFYKGSVATDNKIESIENTYGSGSLAVSKTVTGTGGDKTEAFNVTVTFTSTDTVTSTITYSDDGEEETILPSAWSGGSVSVAITLKDDETVTFENIPDGVTYTVEEDSYTGEGYDAAGYKYSDTTKTINTSDEDTVEITNNRDTKVATGITLDSLPYVLVLVAVLALGAVMIIRKRRVED